MPKKSYILDQPKRQLKHKMKAIIKIISVFLLIFVISPQGYAQSEVMSKFSSSIKAGNVQELIKGLADPVELSIEGQEKVWANRKLRLPLAILSVNTPYKTLSTFTKVPPARLSMPLPVIARVVKTTGLW